MQATAIQCNLSYLFYNRNEYLSFSQGGLSAGYKNYIADKGLNDETYTADSVALIRLSGTSVHNNKAVQVDAVCLLTLSDFFSFRAATNRFHELFQ